MADVSAVLDALGDPTRREIFERLRGSPRCVADVARGLPVSRPAVSQHLKVLKDAGLVADEAQGTRRYYRCRPDGLRVLRGWLDGFWDLALDSFQQAAEAAQREEDSK